MVYFTAFKLYLYLEKYSSLIQALTKNEPSHKKSRPKRVRALAQLEVSLVSKNK